ncbi:hypothetical protein [Cellulomonas alba]|uniref:Uncharacterized protein n=1 Tax=Cellulomonas alba TaxID=3053467 RepID=A0ABT7SG04_9CELL|nr:hypothetical protein [Cellulomonas alba]MDM7855128.1 hypothetical protein [Cellulomonas alba]
MPDLGDMLWRAERALESGYTGRAAAPGAVARAKRLVRRRRTLRHWGEGVGAVAAVGVVGAVVWLGAPGDREPPLPAATGSTAASSPTPTGEPEPSADPEPTESGAATPTFTSTPTAAGCSPGGGGVPVGADVRQVVDVDGDGRPDRAWLATEDDGQRRFGITTASGATFWIDIESASPIQASAVVQLVQSDHVPIALVDFSRSAQVYSLAGCAVTEVLNAQGLPYTFDRGMGDQGTGAGCTLVGGALRLAGLDAVRNPDGTYDVSRTFIDLDAGARHATNESRVVVARGAKADAPVVVTASEVSCGELVAGRDGPVQPMP